MDVLREKTFMSMKIYPIPRQGAILFQWSFIFASSAIRVLKYLLGKWSNKPICE